MQKYTHTLLLVASVISSTAIAADKHPVISGPSASADLIAEISKADQILFDAAFNNCDLEASRNLVTDDFEFYHDKGGRIASSGQQFVDSTREMCEGRTSGRNVKARRELVADSVEVYPLNSFGAIQIGTHRFYAVRDGQPDLLRETGQFTHIWQKVSGQWKLARVLSYNHKPAEGISD